MHKCTKLSPVLRREVYRAWTGGKRTIRQLGRQYHVDKNVISKVIIRGRLGDFSVHDSTNHRYRTIEYGLKRLAAVEARLTKVLAKRERRQKRYERHNPGELVHVDTRRLERIYRKDRYQQAIVPAMVLYVWIDDHSRWLMADILPDRTMWSSATFLEVTAVRSPFPVQCYYSDNGGEFKGNVTHAFAAGCVRLGITQQFTKPRHPWTNGKAERVIKTILNEWYRPNQKDFQNAEEQQKSLYRYVDYYNHQRPHQSLNGLTPAQRLAQYYTPTGDNA